MIWNTQYSARSRLFGLMLTTAVIALYGCNNTQAPQAAKETATPKWHVNLMITGGIAGQSRAISIDHQGVAQFTDHINKSQKNSQISVARLNKLAVLVKIYSEDTPANSTRSQTCRDCFSYTISTEYDGNINRQQLNDLNMDENSQRLIGALKTILSEHTQSSK